MITPTIFANVDSDGDPLSMGDIRDRLKTRTGAWPRKHHGRLVVLEQRGIYRVKSSAMLFAWLYEAFDRVHWRRGPSFVSKTDLFYGLERWAPPVSDAELGVRRIRAGWGYRYVPLNDSAGVLGAQTARCRR